MNSQFDDETLLPKGDSMAPAGSGSGQSGVRCKVGGGTTTVDTAATCESMGGVVVGPKKPIEVCGGCGAAMARVAEELGWGDSDLVKVSREFLERAVRSTTAGRKLFKA